MKILLPPSETKRPGGAGAPLNLSGLALPALVEHRAQTDTNQIVVIHKQDFENAQGGRRYGSHDAVV